MNKRIASALAAAGTASLLLAGPASAGHEGSVYRANLGELNGSGGSGTATLTVSQDGETAAVQINASGLNLDGPHALHIHGIVEGENVTASRCPTSAADADGDGIITVVEGAPDYGGVQVSLTTSGDTTPDSALAVDRFPAGTSVNYNRAGIPLPEVLRPNLGKLHIVLHGIDEDGNGTLTADQEARSSLDESLPREATAPALCGTLTIQSTGAIQTGAGGTAGAGETTGMVASAAGLTALGLGALAMRARRNQAAAQV